MATPTQLFWRRPATRTRFKPSLAPAACFRAAIGAPGTHYRGRVRGGNSERSRLFASLLLFSSAYFFLHHAATASLYISLLTIDTAQTILQFLGDSNILPLRLTEEGISLALELLIPELPEVVSSARTRYERERGNVLAQAAGGEEWLEERDNTEVEEILKDIHEDTAITAPDPGEISPWATTTDARLAWCRYVDNRYRARVRARGVLTTHREALPRHHGSL